MADEVTVPAKVPAAPESVVLSGADRLVDEGTPTLHFGVAVVVEADGMQSTLMIPDVAGISGGKSPVYITKRIAINGKNLQEFLKAKGITLPDALQGKPPTGKGARYVTKSDCDANATEIEVTGGTGSIEVGDFVTFKDNPDAYEVKTALSDAKKFTLTSPLGVPVPAGTAVTLGKPGLIGDTEISCEAFYYNASANGPVLMMFALRFQRGLIRSLTGDDALGKLFDIKGASLRIFKSNKDTFKILQDYVAQLTA